MSVNQTTSPSGLVALSSILPILCIGAVASRFSLRRKQKTHAKIDEWIMLPALTFFIGMCICAMCGVHRRVWGYPTPYAEENSDPDRFNADTAYEGQLVEAFTFLQVLALGTIKLGALFFFRRIFCIHGHRSTFDIISLLFVIVIILWMVSMFIMNAVQCGSHISALWGDPENYVAYCVYAFPFLQGFAISNFLLDLFIILLPVPKIWSLHTSVGRKIAVTGVFGLALVGLAASTTRMATYIKILAVGPSLTADIRLEDTETIFWSNLEAGLSLLAVNLPTLWAFVNKTSMERVIASVRSMLSLNSLRSGRSSRSRSHTRLPDGGTPVRQHPDDSNAKLASKRAEFELYGMQEAEHKEAVSPSPRAASATKDDVNVRNDEMV